jgi:hypothetical protein
VKARSQRPEAFDGRGNRGWFGFSPASRTFFRAARSQIAHVRQHRYLYFFAAASSAS